MFRVGRHRCGGCVMSDWNEFGPERRKEIRDKLEIYVKRLGRKAIVHAIEKDFEAQLHPDTIKRFLKNPQSTSDGNVALFESFVRRQESLHEARQRQEVVAPTADELRLFPALQAFFQMTPQKVEQYCAKIVGTWAFFAFSEKGRDHVVQGAIRFEIGPDGDFNADELQEQIIPAAANPVTLREVHAGHFLFRKDSMIVLLKERVHAIPKLYILTIEPFYDNKGNHVLMEGALLKVGSKGDVFSTKIRLVRDESAFEHCSVRPTSAVPPSIIDHIS